MTCRVEIPGLPGYFASSDGHIWSSHRPRGSEKNLFKLKEWPDKDGYLYVVGYIDNKRTKKFRVHRMVLLAFDGAPPANHVGTHIDGIKTNNSVHNLRWATQAENIADRTAHGTTARGERSGNAKLTAMAVLDIRDRLAQYGDRKLPNGVGQALANEYGVDVHTIKSVRMGRTWSHV